MMYVKNDIVRDNYWEAEGFVEDKRVGFICAIHDYHGVPVVFQEGIAFTMIDAEGPLDIESIKSVIKKSFKINKADGSRVHVYSVDEFEEYVELASEEGKTLSEANLRLAGLTDEDVADMKERFEDLSGYYYERFVDSL